MSPERLRRRLHQDEQGIALVFVLFAILIMAASATLVFRIAMAEVEATAESRDHENALPVTEAGIDAVIAVLNQDGDFTTQDATGSAHVMPASVTTLEQQKAWALAMAADPSECSDDAGDDASIFVASGMGETCALRPVDTAGDPIDLIFGVGFVPSRANPQEVRVVRVEYDRGFYSPSMALLTEGDLRIVGTPSFLGNAGNVHTNGDLTVNGSGPTVEGSLSFTGVCTASCPYQDPSNTPRTAVDRPAEYIPEFDARSLYDEHVGRWDDWYNLCPWGVVYKVVSGTTDTTPCDGTDEVQVWDDATDPADFRGMRWFATSATTAEWRISGGTAVGNGIYYVVDGQVQMGGSPGTLASPLLATFIVQATVVCGTTANDNGSRSGNFSVTGNPVMRPFLNDLTVVADRDVNWAGTPGQDIEGFIGAVEQIAAGSNVKLHGSLMSRDQCHTGGSPVSANDINGTMDLTFNGGMAVPVDSLVRIVAWNEL